MATALQEDVTIKKEFNHPAYEIVNFITAGSGDYYNSEKFGQIEGAFAAQRTADGTEIRVTWDTQPNGQPRIYVYPSTGNPTGCLIIIGRK